MHVELSYGPLCERNVGLPDPVNDIRTRKTERKPNKSLQLSPKAPIGAANVVAIAVSAGLMRRRN